MLILFCFEGTSKVWAVDQEEEKRDLVTVKYVLLLVPDFVPLSTCGNSPVGLPLGCVSAAGMGERSVWDLHPYLSPEMRLHCVSALAVSWKLVVFFELAEAGNTTLSSAAGGEKQLQ